MAEEVKETMDAVVGAGEPEKELKVNINKISKDTIEVVIEGARHTLPNIIRDELWEDGTVSLAAYEKAHPYLGDPRLIIKAKDPKKALLDAVKRTEEKIKKFEKEFAKAAGK